MSEAGSSTPPGLSQAELTVLTETFRLLGDPSRLRILLCCLDATKSVSQICEATGLSQSLVSHHLRLLRAARLVRGERRSKHVFYELADQHVRDILADMITHIGEDHDDH